VDAVGESQVSLRAEQHVCIWYFADTYLVGALRRYNRCISLTCTPWLQACAQGVYKLTLQFDLRIITARKDTYVFFVHL
jgi:hypothetical protein